MAESTPAPEQPPPPAGTAPESAAAPAQDTETIAGRLAGQRALLPVVTATPILEKGMFGAHDTGDTTGFGGLVRRVRPVLPTPPPWGEWYDDAYAALAAAYPSTPDAVEAVVVEHGEMTLHVGRDHLVGLLGTLRDGPALRFELLSSLSGVDYPDDAGGRRLHAVYHLTSLTYRRRLRVEVAVSEEDPHIPSAMAVYPTADWHEREVWDFFGIVFDGRTGLTRILMPDDWDGHPGRKDYPLGGIPVEYKGASIPPPDERRRYA
jgi:NADH-quinone oxidoreductase subunit C